MNVRLAQTDDEWAAVLAVLCSFAVHLQPFTTPDTALQALQAYAQQMVTWWMGRNTVIKRVAKRGTSGRHSDATSGEVTSATSDEGNADEPKKKKRESKQWGQDCQDDSAPLWGPSNSLPMSMDNGFLPSSTGEQAPAQYKATAHSLAPTEPSTMWGIAQNGASPMQSLWWNQTVPVSEEMAGTTGRLDELLVANHNKVCSSYT